MLLACFMSYHKPKCPYFNLNNSKYGKNIQSAADALGIFYLQKLGGFKWNISTKRNQKKTEGLNMNITEKKQQTF